MLLNSFCCRWCYRCVVSYCLGIADFFYIFMVRCYLVSFDLKTVARVYSLGSRADSISRFLRDLDHLRGGADYRSVDTSGIADWLQSINPKFGQYTYRLVHVGIDRSFLPKLTEEHLRSDCEIENGIHRTKILTAAQGHLGLFTG